MSGKASRIIRMPSSVHWPSLRSSSLPVAMVKVSGSISRSDCASPCLLQAKSTSRVAMRSLSSAVFAMPTSSMVRAMTHGAEFLRQDQPVLGRLLAILEVDRVDDRLAAMQLQRGLDHRRLGAVDHQRRVHRGGEAGDDLVHLLHLVAADEGGADVEAVGAFADLLAADRDAAIPVMHRLALAPGLRAIGVAALADGEDRRSPGAAAPRRRARRPRGSNGLPRDRRRPMQCPLAPCFRSIASSAWICGVEVPQQPPIRLTPSSRMKRSIQLAISAAPSG